MPPDSTTDCLSVFDYQDYHEYLSDWMQARKSSRLSFSYQEFANRCGLKSRSFLRLVCVGTKQLSSAAAVKVSQAMGHSAREHEYFTLLVAFNNSKDLQEKRQQQDRLRKIPRPTRGTTLSAQHFSVFSKWYIVVVWELVTVHDFKGDFRALGKMLIPPITAQEAESAVNLLLEMGMIERSGSLYVQSKTYLFTREDMNSETIKSYQVQTMQLAQEALEVVPVEHRHIGTLTLGFDETTWKDARERILQLRQELADISQRVKRTERVYQLNVQLFPVSRDVPLI